MEKDFNIPAIRHVLKWDDVVEANDLMKQIVSIEELRDEPSVAMAVLYRCGLIRGRRRERDRAAEDRRKYREKLAAKEETEEDQPTPGVVLEVSPDGTATEHDT